MVMMVTMVDHGLQDRGAAASLTPLQPLPPVDEALQGRKESLVLPYPLTACAVGGLRRRGARRCRVAHGADAWPWIRIHSLIRSFVHV